MFENLFGPGNSNQSYAMPDSPGVYRVIWLIVVFDISSSMLDYFSSTKNKLTTTIEAAQMMLGLKHQHRPDDRVAIVAYSSQGTQCCHFLQAGKDAGQLVNSVRSLDALPHGGTYLATGLEIALGLMNQARDHRHASDLLYQVISYSDGHDAATGPAIALAHRLKEMGCLVETFGVARDRREVNEEFLRTVATTDLDGVNHYRFIGDAEQLHQVFKSISKGSLVIED